MSLPTNRFPAPGSPLVAPLAWGLIAAAAGIATARFDPNVLEEGIILHTAERMLGGEHLYRDVIVHTAPLPYELLAALFRVFGAEIAVARALLVAVQALATALVFALVRRSGRAGGNELAHAAAAAVATAPIFLFPQLSNYYYTTLALYLTLIAAYIGERGLRSPAWCVAAGAMVSLVALCKQTTGLAFAATFVPVLIALAPREARVSRTLAAVAGGAGVAVATLGLYAWRGDLRDLVYCTVELPLSMGGTFRSPFPNFWPPGELDAVVRENWVMYVPSLYYLKHGLFAVLGAPIIVLTQLLYAVPFLAAAASAARAATAGLTPAAWLHGAVLVTMMLNVFPRASWGHLVVALPPALVQLLLILPRPARGGGLAPRLRKSLTVLAIGTLLTSGATAAWIEGQAGPSSFGPRVPQRPVSRAYKQPGIPRVIQYLRRHVGRGQPIFVTRQEPLLYFATETRNPTRFGGVLPGLRELQEGPILEALADVRYVVMSDIDQPLYTYYADELPAVQAYLERHFAVPRDFSLDDFSWIVVVARGRDRGATAIDLIAERASGWAWVRDRDGEVRPAPWVPQQLAARQLNRPLPIALGPGGGGIDFDLELPEGAVFQAGIGYRGLVSIDHHYLQPPGVTLALLVRRAGKFEELAAVRINDDLRAGRRWLPFEVDLSDYAGERLTLRLEARAHELEEPDMLTWWGSPRIAVKPADRPPPGSPPAPMSSSPP